MIDFREQTSRAARVPSSLVALSEILKSVAMGGQVEVSTVLRAPRAQKRIDQDEATTRLFEQALALRQRVGIPFWDALFIEGEQHLDGLPLDVAISALLHQPIRGQTVRSILIEEDLSSKLELIAIAAGQNIVAISSRVTLRDGSTRHIPMIDFATKQRRVGSERTVINAAQALGVPGIVVASGRSFHFYGRRMMTAAEREEFLYRAVLLAPITDSRWIAHQLLEGNSSLRISADPTGEFPQLVTEVVNDYQ